MKVNSNTWHIDYISMKYNKFMSGFFTMWYILKDLVLQWNNTNISEKSSLRNTPLVGISHPLEIVCNHWISLSGMKGFLRQRKSSPQRWEPLHFAGLAYDETSTHWCMDLYNPRSRGYIELNSESVQPSWSQTVNYTNCQLGNI